MSLPGNGIFVVRGEMSTLMTAMRRGSRWNSAAYVEDEKEGLMKLFVDLKQVLNRIEDLRQIEPNIFLTPFLEVIRTDETTGAVTSLALAAVNKFLCFGLIDPTTPNLVLTVESIVDAVTHARFMGTDQSSDGVTLFRVVEVLHTLMRSPEGSVLTNEAVCEIMLSCFKICFEPRLNELLRRFAEQALKDMVLLLFMRLPQFAEERSDAALLKKFQIMATDSQTDKKKRLKSSKSDAVRHEIRKETSKRAATAVVDNAQSPHDLGAHLKAPPLATTPATPAGNIVDMRGKITQTPTTALVDTNAAATAATAEVVIPATEEAAESNAKASCEQQINEDEQSHKESLTDHGNEYINSVGVRFTQQIFAEGSENGSSLFPYGLPCIQELIRFLILLCNPLDKQNTDIMMHMGLSLLTVAFEVGADNIGKYDSLLSLVKDDLCRNLITLMNSERLTIFAANLQLCFLLFESLRGHLKFQLEVYLKKLSDIIATDNPKISYEVRELALDNLLQLYRIPGFVAELYINYDCDLYCSDLFEQLTNILSKYTLSSTGVIYTTHTIALDALVTVIENIERNCTAAKNIANMEEPLPLQSNRHSRNNSVLDGSSLTIVSEAESKKEQDDSRSTETIENISKFINNTMRLQLAQTATTAKATLTRDQLLEIKQKKRILAQGTEIFNKRPEKGILYLQENGMLNPQMNPNEVAMFLRENPGIDKNMIGEYITKKKNVDAKILLAFVESFDFTGLRIDQALRLYLETFRLSGEAQVIFLVLEHFADRWHKQNGEPFASADAAFSLAYAIIMLNMDQHNSNAKRLNVPMTQEDFAKNLRGVNGGADFDQELLAAIFNAIKNEEIVMPAEQTGLVRENYLWKVLLRRSNGTDGVFNYVYGSTYDIELFQIIYGAALSALGFMFDRSSEWSYQRTLTGFIKCAAISAHYNLLEDFDSLILTLCKFTTLLNKVPLDSQAPVQNEIAIAVSFGLNAKAQSALKTVFTLVHDHGDCLREAWKNILDLFAQMFRLNILPKSLMEVEDFCEANGKAQLLLEKPFQKPEAGLFSSLYSYLSSESQREPSKEEQEVIKVGKKCIKDCQLEQIIQESKFMQLESLQELFKNILTLITPPCEDKNVCAAYAEDITVFWMEFLVKVVIHNRDRMLSFWYSVRDRLHLLLIGAATFGYEYLLNRSIVAVLKLAIYLMRNEELCPIVLQSLKMILLLKSNVLLHVSKQISTGLYELLKTSAQNIHSEQDWQIIFTILECIGAGAEAPIVKDTSLPTLTTTTTAASSEGQLKNEEDRGPLEQGYVLSDSDMAIKQQQQKQQQSIPSLPRSNASSPIASSPTTENWILVNKDSDFTVQSRSHSPLTAISQNRSTPSLCVLTYERKLNEHSPFALFKCWDSLAFIVRNVAHITPYNFESCVRCIRTFVEACKDGGRTNAVKNSSSAAVKRKTTIKRVANSETSAADVQSDNEDSDLLKRYETLSLQLLDLMYILYTRTAQIFRWWAEEGCVMPQCSALWAQGWCPLLLGIARFAMDKRREVRTFAISCLQQRALLVHDLQALSGAEWASCFQRVLFPLLNELQPDSSSIVDLDAFLLEESRIRMATIMSKVFLHHLTPLIELGSAFNELWIEILNYIEKFMRVGSDMLFEQMLEILKNMLLVMHSVRVFHNVDGSLQQPLWDLTWKRIGEFLPNLKTELFGAEVSNRALNEKTNTADVGDEQLSLNTIAFRESNEAQLDEHSAKVDTLTQIQGVFQVVPPQPMISADSLGQISESITNQHTATTAVSNPVVSSASSSSSVLPDLISDANLTRVSAAALGNTTNATVGDYNSHSIAIELPEEPIVLSEQFQFESITNPLFLHQRLHNFGDHQQHQQLKMFETSQQSQISNDQFVTKTIIEPCDTAPDAKTIANRNVSLPTPKDPNATSINSFVPMFTQSPHHQADADIYHEFLLNPYNTSYEPRNSQASPLPMTTYELPTTDYQKSQQNSQIDSNNQFVSASNYFSSKVDPKEVPAGTEMLYSQL